MLQNKVSIASGGANGIGRTTVLALARDGSDVAISDIITPSPRGVLTSSLEQDTS